MKSLEQKVMAGVATIYLARLFTSARALKAYALFLASLGVVLFASVPHVVANFLSVGGKGFPAVYTFLLSAVTETSFVVQVGLLVAAVALVSLVRDIARPVEAPNFAS